MITTYFALTLISILIIVVAVFLGKKLRDAKDASDAKKTVQETAKEEN